MRLLGVLAVVVAAALVLVLWLRPEPETFDDRFERTQKQLEAMAQSIEADLDKVSSDNPASRARGGR
ncbi:MAG: hypothetical protein AAF291_01355 [Pseudomonadota bacterium]